jgi:hypothetical protein
VPVARNTERAAQGLWGLGILSVRRNSVSGDRHRVKVRPDRRFPLPLKCSISSAGCSGCLRIFDFQHAFDDLIYTACWAAGFALRLHLLHEAGTLAWRFNSERFTAVPLKGIGWLLARSTETGRVFVRHEPNLPSGGQPADIEIGAFFLPLTIGQKSKNSCG